MTSRVQLARQRELRRLQSFAWERSDGKEIIREESDPKPGLLLFFTELARVTFLLTIQCKASIPWKNDPSDTRESFNHLQ